MDQNVCSLSKDINLMLILCYPTVCPGLCLKQCRCGKTGSPCSRWMTPSIPPSSVRSRTVWDTAEIRSRSLFGVSLSVQYFLTHFHCGGDSWTSWKKLTSFQTSKELQFRHKADCWHFSCLYVYALFVLKIIHIHCHPSAFSYS